MLTTLKNYTTTQERERVLASIAERLLPQPVVPTKDLTEEEELLLAEMRNQLNLDATDNSVAAQTALLRLLSDEMSSSIQSEPRRTQIEASLKKNTYLWLELGHDIEGARLSEHAQPSATSVLPPQVTLSNRELEILRLIAYGLDTQQVAQRLYVSPFTVRNHLHHIMKKLNVQRRLEAIKYAFERQWLIPTRP
jgi:DNA-binding NarL/FixJ family response regulator